MASIYVIFFFLTISLVREKESRGGGGGLRGKSEKRKKVHFSKESVKKKTIT